MSPTSNHRTLSAPKASSMTGACVCRMYDEVEKTASLSVSVGLSGPSGSGASDGDGTMLLSGASSASARERKFGARAFAEQNRRGTRLRGALRDRRADPASGFSRVGTRRHGREHRRVGYVGRHVAASARGASSFGLLAPLAHRDDTHRSGWREKSRPDTRDVDRPPPRRVEAAFTRRSGSSLAPLEDAPPRREATRNQPPIVPTAAPRAPRTATRDPPSRRRSCAPQR